MAQGVSFMSKLYQRMSQKNVQDAWNKHKSLKCRKDGLRGNLIKNCNEVNVKVKKKKKKVSFVLSCAGALQNDTSSY